MTYESSKNKMKRNQGKELDKGFGITDKDKSRAVANNNVIDCNKRIINDKINKKEPHFTE